MWPGTLRLIRVTLDGAGRNRVRRRTVGHGTLALLALAARAQWQAATTTSAPADAKARPQVTIDAKDFGFTLPAQIPAGWVDVTAAQPGQDRSPDRVREAGLGLVRHVQDRGGGHRPEGLRADVGVRRRPEQRRPGRSRSPRPCTSTPGKYGVACFIPADKDGKSHAAHGHGRRGRWSRRPPTRSRSRRRPTAARSTLSEFTFLPDASFNGTGHRRDQERRHAGPRDDHREGQPRARRSTT